MADFLSRARTPTSPSPSPEPVDGPGELTGGQQPGLTTITGAGAGAGATGVGVGVATSSSSTYGQQTMASSNPSSDQLLPSSSIGGAGDGIVVATSSMISQQDQSEIARQVLEEKIRIGVEDLMQLAMCAGDVQPGDEEIVKMKINETMESLQAIQDATNLPNLNQMIPEDVMGMIDQGRNPDTHTRTMTNRLNGDNQQMRGQAINFDRYRSRLRSKIEAAFPEMKVELEAMDTV